MKSPTTIQAVAAKRILYGSTLRQLHGVLADRGLRSTPENWDLSWSVGTIYTTLTSDIPSTSLTSFSHSLCHTDTKPATHNVINIYKGIMEINSHTTNPLITLCSITEQITAILKQCVKHKCVCCVYLAPVRHKILFVLKQINWKFNAENGCFFWFLIAVSGKGCIKTEFN